MSLPAVYLAFWTLLAMPPNQLVALPCRVVRATTIFFVSVVILLLQQGMLCNCKSRVLQPDAVCLPAKVCLGHPVLPTV